MITLDSFESRPFEQSLVLVSLRGACFNHAGPRSQPIPGAAQMMYHVVNTSATLLYVIDEFDPLEGVLTWTSRLKKFGFPVPGPRHIRIVMRNASSESWKHFLEKLMEDFVPDQGQLVGFIGGAESEFFRWASNHGKAHLPSTVSLLDASEGYTPDILTKVERCKLVKVQEYLWAQLQKNLDLNNKERVSVAQFIHQLLSRPHLSSYGGGRCLSLPSNLNQKVIDALTVKYTIHIDPGGSLKDSRGQMSQGDGHAVRSVYLKLPWPGSQHIQSKGGGGDA